MSRKAIGGEKCLFQVYEGLQLIYGIPFVLFFLLSHFHGATSVKICDMALTYLQSAVDAEG